MMDKDLLSILACPQTKISLELADQHPIENLNQLIEKGELVNQEGGKVTKKIDGGLYRVGDRNFLYPVRNGIPILLVEELLSVEKIK